MGNLRDKYTDEEWDELQNRKSDLPSQIFLKLSLYDLSLEQLIILKENLLNIYQDSQLEVINEWIKFNKK